MTTRFRPQLFALKPATCPPRSRSNCSTAPPHGTFATPAGVGATQASHVEQVLVPTLRAGNIVLTDNLSGHKRVAAVRAIEGALGARTCPPYSPDFNRIEPGFAEIKVRLRAAEPRTIEKVENFFGPVHEAFTPDECGNYIRPTGYTATH